MRLHGRARLRQDARRRRVAGGAGDRRPGRPRSRGHRADVRRRQVHLLSGPGRLAQGHPPGACRKLQQHRSDRAGAHALRQDRHDPRLHGREARAPQRPAARRHLVRRAGGVAVRAGDVGHGAHGPAPRRPAADPVDHDAQADRAGAPPDRAQAHARAGAGQHLRQQGEPAAKLLRPARPVRGHGHRPAGAGGRADRPRGERRHKAELAAPQVGQEAAPGLRLDRHVAGHGLHRGDHRPQEPRPGLLGVHGLGRLPAQGQDARRQHRRAVSRPAAGLLAGAARPAGAGQAREARAEHGLRRRPRHRPDQAPDRQLQAQHERPQARHRRDRGQGQRHQPAPSA